MARTMYGFFIFCILYSVFYVYVPSFNPFDVCEYNLQFSAVLYSIKSLEVRNLLLFTLCYQRPPHAEKIIQHTEILLHNRMLTSIKCAVVDLQSFALCVIKYIPIPSREFVVEALNFDELQILKRGYILY